MNKKISRRRFAQMAGATAVAAPVLTKATAAHAEAADAPLQEQQAAAPSADTKPKYGMTKEQEDRVKQAVERNERGRGTLRAFPLSYAAEPSFVFKARVKTK